MVTPVQQHFLKVLSQYPEGDQEEWLARSGVKPWMLEGWADDVAFQRAYRGLRAAVNPRAALQEVVVKGLEDGRPHALSCVVQAARALIALDESQPLPVGATGGNTMKTQRRLARVINGKQDNIVTVDWPHPDDHEKVFNDSGKH